jgi:hypothetical protein
MLAHMESGQGENPHQTWQRTWARWALQQWETFPVDARPRPLILTAPPFRFERGFRSGGAKMAFFNGDIAATVPLPEGLLEVLHEGRPGARHGKSPLLITQADRCQAEFASDRGRREFPAWRLGGPGIDGAMLVLDPAIVSRCWTPPEPAPPKPLAGLPHRAASAAVESDGMTLHFTFTGSPPAYTDYPGAETVETGQALVVLPVARDVGPPGWRQAVGCIRTVVTRLASPLGERAVVDLDASPVMVQAHEVPPDPRLPPRNCTPGPTSAWWTRPGNFQMSGSYPGFVD